MLIWHGKKVMKSLEGKSPGIKKHIAEVIAENARQIVPVKTGTLKSTIKVTGGDTVVAGGNKAPYAGAVEYGTSKRAAQPYIRPAIERLTDADIKNSIS